jgi:hypothetical protein
MTSTLGNGMAHLHHLLSALQVIFETGIEFREDSFVELTPAQYASYLRKFDKQLEERLFRVVQIEPGVVGLTGSDQTVLELTIVTATERNHLMEAVRLIYSATQELDATHPSFAERFDGMRMRLRDAIKITSAPDDRRNSGK